MTSVTDLYFFKFMAGQTTFVQTSSFQIISFQFARLNRVVKNILKYYFFN